VAISKKGTSAAKGGNQASKEKGSAGANVDQSNSAGSIPGLEVTSTQDGFWRAGLQWSSKPTTVKLSDLTPEQVQDLEWDPSLTVVEVDIPVDQEGS